MAAGMQCSSRVHEHLTFVPVDELDHYEIDEDAEGTQRSVDCRVALISQSFLLFFFVQICLLALNSSMS
jgi:hypothetical protein